MSAQAATRALVALLGAGCSVEQTLVEPDPGLERMVDQPRYAPFGASAFFRDGRAMRAPPAGTVPVERRLVAAPVALGTENGRPVERVPRPVTRALLERGRERFDLVCATCHGVLGNGESPVARAMQLRRPPSLHASRLRDAPPGAIYRVVTEGYGLMPSFRDRLDVDERWAVVAYVRALQLSQFAPVASLPVDVRAALAREAP